MKGLRGERKLSDPLNLIWLMPAEEELENKKPPTSWQVAFFNRGENEGGE